MAKPFVAIIDAFNATEDTYVKEVSYFSAKEVDPNFVGIKVQSGPNRIDHIFNDEKGLKIHEFESGNFKGTYGIVSYEGDKLHSIFLGNGQELEMNSWKIEAFQPDANVLIEVDGAQIMVASAQPFALTMPLDKKFKKPVLITKGNSGAQEFIGKIIKSKKQKLARFELPAMDGVVLELK